MPRDVWEIVWRVQEQENYAGAAAEFLALPVRLEAEELWWLHDGRLVTRGRAAPSPQPASLGPSTQGPARTVYTVLDPLRGWVIRHVVGTERAQATPWDHWLEERVRTARRRYLAVLAEQASAPQRGDLRYFLGDLERESFRTEQGDEWHALAAAPGRLWKLAGSESWEVPWTQPPLVLGFGGVSPIAAPRLGQLLAEMRPRRLQEVSLPTGDRSLVLSRLLVRARRVPALPGESQRLCERLWDETLARERTRESAALLWTYLTEPAQRPADLDAPGVRARLQRVARAADLPALAEHLVTRDDAVEREELLLLVEAVDPQRFDAWLALGLEQDDVALLIPMASVISLRRPAVALELLERLREISEDWTELEPADRTQIQAWLDGLRRWHTQDIVTGDLSRAAAAR